MGTIDLPARSVGGAVFFARTNNSELILLTIFVHDMDRKPLMGYLE
ncbi:hypothetical protein CEV34_3670 [Brucella pseudogrignonensis]|uniref:Uncharacterized protein n=1 Tax=Brucella pseudogrignonensis TaxID=419475 RepID=A0A256G9P9_9HYPH|nr:hypothetical protein CEV34_3670 [Brucella pseudogrignonensis]